MPWWRIERTCTEAKWRAGDGGNQEVDRKPCEMELAFDDILQGEQRHVRCHVSRGVNQSAPLRGTYRLVRGHQPILPRSDMSPELLAAMDSKLLLDVGK